MLKLITRLKPLHILLAILMFTTIVYLPHFDNGFVWDDSFFILNRDKITPLSLQTLVDGTHPIATTNVYRPVRNLFYPLTYLLFGTNPFGYHFFTLTLHLLITSLVFLLSRKLTRSLLVTTLATTIFAIHPIHVEAVSWITAGFDLVFVLFYLLSIYFYLPPNRRLNWSRGLALLAFLSNELALTLPLFLILYEKFYNQKSLKQIFTQTKIVSYLALAAFYLFARTYFITNPRESVRVYQNPASIILLAIALLGQYFKLFALPLELSADHHFAPQLNGLFSIDHNLNLPIPSLTETSFFYTSLITLAVTSCLLFFTRKQHFAKLAIFWAIVSLIPVLRISGIPIIFAERYAYLATIGLSFFLAYLIIFLYRQHHQLKPAIIATTIVLIGFYTYQTTTRIDAWQNNQHFWQTTYAQNPEAAGATNSLCVIHYENQDYQTAYRFCSLTKTLNPFVTSHQQSIINVLLKLEKHQELLDFLLTFRENNQDNVEYLYTLGEVYEQFFDDSASALQYYNQALLYAPNNKDLLEAVERLSSP